MITAADLLFANQQVTDAQDRIRLERVRIAELARQKGDLGEARKLLRRSLQLLARSRRRRDRIAAKLFEETSLGE